MNKKVFVTYSWDSKEHQNWVIKLTNTMRKKDGIDATCDVYELENKNININRMMVENISKKDFIVVVLTEGYAKKANEELGGVGYESTMLMSILNDKKLRDKIIILSKHSGNYNETIPDFLNGWKFIDISGSKLEEGYEELVRRIKSKPKYIKPELGIGNELKPEEIGTFDFGDIGIPNLTPITPQSREAYISKSFGIILEKIKNIFIAIKQKNNNFDYSITDNTSHFNIKVILEGNTITDINIWIGGIGSDTKESISYQFNSYSGFNPNSANGWFNVKVGKDKKLELHWSFGVLQNNELNREKSIKQFIEKQFIEPLKNHHSNSLISRY